jgi:hypothetical protein
MRKHHKYGIIPHYACPAGIAIIACIAFAIAAGCTSGNPPAITPLPATPAIPVPSQVVTETAATPMTLPSVSLTKIPAPQSSPTDCTSDAECVPAQCCHPTSCINAAEKHVCTLLCTDVCQGPIDCGAGHCGCVNRQCAVQPGPAP